MRPNEYYFFFFFFAFYAKIQDSWENDFWGKSQVDSADTLWVKSFVKITLSRSVSEINTFLAFYAEIQNGHQKRRENDLWQKSPVYSADTLWVKHFIALIHPIQWTIAYPVGADRPAKRQKKTSCVATSWPVRSTVHSPDGASYFLPV